MGNAFSLQPECPPGSEGAWDEGMRILLHIEEMRAGMAMLAACLEAAAGEPAPAPSASAEFLCAYA